MDAEQPPAPPAKKKNVPPVRKPRDPLLGRRVHAKKPDALMTGPLKKADGTVDQRSAVVARIDDPKIRVGIVAAIAAGATVEVAARIMNVPYSQIYDRRSKDDAFRGECESARAWTTAVLGMTAVQAARRVGTDREKPSDHVMLIFCLKNFDPVHWRDRKELEVAIGDIPGTLREAAERVRERKRLRAGSVLAAVVASEADDESEKLPGEVVPYVPTGGGGNGNGYK